MTATTPVPRPRPGDSARPGDRDRGSGPARRRRIRWGRIPGRIILAICFVAGAAALVVAVLPFTTTTDDGTELRCGPAVFEVLIPPDPVFDDVPENGGCEESAKSRLVIAGAVLVGALLVAAVTERQTRRGSVRRDARWLASSANRSARRRRDRRAAVGSGSPRSDRAEVGPAPADDRSLPPSRS